MLRLSHHATTIYAFLAVSAAATTMFGWEARANACSPPPCVPARVAPSEAASIPSNTPAIPYIASTGGGGGAGANALHLLGPTTAEVGTSVRSDAWWSTAMLLEPTASLTTGHHVLTYTEACTFGGASSEGARGFDVGAAATLPTTIGALHAANWKVGNRSVANMAGACFSNVNAVSIDVVLKAPPELVAFAPVTSFKVNVDGKPALSVFYGEGKVLGDTITIGQLYATCGTRSADDDNGLTLGTHDVEVHAHVAGAASDPAVATARFLVSCENSDVETVGDTTNPDDTRTPAGSDDAGATQQTPRADGGNAAAPNDPTATAGCACDTAGRRSSPPLAFVSALVALAALVRRRVSGRGPSTRS